MSRQRVLFSALTLALVAALGGAAGAQAPAAEHGPSEAQKAFASIQWTAGPAKVPVGGEAEIAIPAGMKFTGPEGTRKMLEIMRNPTDGSELGMLTTENLDWFMTFDFSDIGYVKDADKEKLDGKEILASIKEGNEASNEARRERGWPPINITGWHTEPFYNKDTNNLEWCIKGESEGQVIINYNTRILGRGGVMSANLMVDPAELDKVLPVAKQVLGGFSYVQGKRYAEWRSGDKIAKYGLTALVVGGAVGAAAKLGFLGKVMASLGKLWKFVIIGLIGLAAGLKKLLTRKKDQPAPPPSVG